MSDLQKARGPACPRCGCEDCRILKHPDNHRWFSSSHGRAQCGHCGIMFSIQKVEAPEVQHAEPVIDGVRSDQPKPKPVRYQILCCPACGSEKVRVTKTERPVRHHKCRDCGECFKTVEEKQRPGA